MSKITWNLSLEKCFEIIQYTLIDILSENKTKSLNIDKLVELLNQRTKIYKLHNSKKYNSFSKYLKIEYNGILNFIENYNFYGVVKTHNEIIIKLYSNLVDLNDLKYTGKRITKDSEWIMIDELGEES
tara:strand:+ start:1316 stop:1699 length:384 start_codon:yes stop_codon:yes gene_type:complete